MKIAPRKIPVAKTEANDKRWLIKVNQLRKNRSQIEKLAKIFRMHHLEYRLVQQIPNWTEDPEISLSVQLLKNAIEN